MKPFFTLLGISLLVAAIGCGDDANNVGGSGAGGDDGGGGGNGGDDGGPPDPTCDGVEEQPSTQAVVITVTNQAAAERFVVLGSSGDECDTFSYARVVDGEGQPLTMGVGFQCGCECAGPEEGYHSELQRLAPGESLTLEWDAREAAICISGYEDCGEEGYEPYESARRSPVAPGDYVIGFRVVDALPAEGCELVGAQASCGSYAIGCASDQQIGVPFTLPVSGDLAVDATITQ
jgi:hypothetical protein